jgi:hypothetical protein
MLNEGEQVSIIPTAMDALIDNPDYAGAIWALADVDMAKLDTRSERINISLPAYVLSQVDDYVAKRGESRSGFLARAAIQTLTQTSR